MNKGSQHGRDAFLARLANKLGRSEPLRRPPDRDVCGVPAFFAERRLEPAERVERFVRSWEALGGKARVVKAAEAPGAVREFLLEAVRAHGVRSVSRWEHPDLTALGLDAALAAEGVAVVPWKELPEAEAERLLADIGDGSAAGASGPEGSRPGGGSNWASRSALLRATERCRLGLVWPDAAIADTGTLALAAGGGRGGGRSAS